jgi:hypothetical protein
MLSSMGEYVRNHITTSGYLDGFTDATGRLMAMRLRAGGRGGLSVPDAVAFRNNFWGRSPELRRQMEQHLAQLEGEVAGLLRELSPRWPLPLGSNERIKLAHFLALHALRTPGWRRLVPTLGARVINEDPEYLSRRFDRSVDEMLAEANSDKWLAETLKSQVPLLGRVLASMHWSLVEFVGPALITSDQPLVAIPFDGMGAGETVQPLPAAGLLRTLEYRFAVDARHLLVMTWIESHEPAELILGTPWIAATANRSARAQADAEWFHHPAINPQFVAAPFLSGGDYEALSPRLMPFYSAYRALVSQRRRATARQTRDAIRAELSTPRRAAS